jgi:hypothetical protein
MTEGQGELNFNLAEHRTNFLGSSKVLNEVFLPDRTSTGQSPVTSRPVPDLPFRKEDPLWQLFPLGKADDLLQ